MGCPYEDGLTYEELEQALEAEARHVVSLDNELMGALHDLETAQAELQRLRIEAAQAAALRQALAATGDAFDRAGAIEALQRADSIYRTIAPVVELGRRHAELLSSVMPGLLRGLRGALAALDAAECLADELVGGVTFATAEAEVCEEGER